jgi:hypothetical protein
MRNRLEEFNEELDGQVKQKGTGMKQSGKARMSPTWYYIKVATGYS